MSYFNHAFNKAFVGTAGFINDGTATSALTTGQFGFYNPKTWTNQTTAPTNCCPLVLVSGSIHPIDKIGPYHGGYSESVKSKTINPKYVQSFYKVLPCAPQQSQILVGATHDSNGVGFTSCEKQFLCGETYNLRLDIKGSPVLRYLTRNTYYTSAAYTGCCPEGELAPSAVNPLVVYAKWAYDFLNSPLISPFVQVVVTYSTDGGLNWNALNDGTNSEAQLELLYNTYNGSFPVGTDATTLAGLIITGAYVDTRFSNCTFYPTDSIIAFLEPVKIYASEVDLNGDPCTFEGLCVETGGNNQDCLPQQLKGTGENVIRDVIMTEAYMQQPFYTGTDLRIREITNGTDVYDAVDRTAFYTRYYIQHSVPRFNNPTGTFDNDQYLLEIIGLAEIETLATANSAATTVTVASTFGIAVGTMMYINGVSSGSTVVSVNSANSTVTISGNETVTGGDVLLFADPSLATFETFVETWLDNCGACETLTIYACPSQCTPTPGEFIID